MKLLVGDDDAGHAGAPERAVHRAHEGAPRAGDRVPRDRVGGDRRHQARLAAAAGHGRGDAHAERRALDAVPERREDRRAVVGSRAGARSRCRSGCPTTVGIAGAVFTSGKTINIPYAYADLRFNPAFDKQTGYFTRSILCVPIVNKHGKDHRRDPGAQQARRAVHRRGRVAAEGVHRADLDRARERQAVRRRAEHEELQREHARIDVERRAHARRERQRSSPATPRACASCAPGAAHHADRPAQEFFAGAECVGARQADRASSETQQPEVTMDAELDVRRRAASRSTSP